MLHEVVWTSTRTASTSVFLCVNQVRRTDLLRLRLTSIMITMINYSARALDASKSPEEKELDNTYRQMVRVKKKLKKEIKQLGQKPGEIPEFTMNRTGKLLHRNLYRDEDLRCIDEFSRPTTPESNEEDHNERVAKQRKLKLKRLGSILIFVSLLYCISCSPRQPPVQTTSCSKILMIKMSFIWFF